MPGVCDTNSADAAVPLRQLWKEFQAEHTIYLDDYYEDMQKRIKEGKLLVSSVLPPLEDKLSIEDGDGGTSLLSASFDKIKVECTHQSWAVTYHIDNIFPDRLERNSFWQTTKFSFNGLRMSRIQSRSKIWLRWRNCNIFWMHSSCISCIEIESVVVVVHWHVRRSWSW